MTSSDARASRANKSEMMTWNVPYLTSDFSEQRRLMDTNLGPPDKIVSLKMLGDSQSA
jgi:hypothetical protein